MSNKENDLYLEHKQMDDEALDALLAEWAKADTALPEGFHESVMTRLRAEQETINSQQKKGTLVSLSERFASKKTWVSATLAAALILCCLPVLQTQQSNVGNVQPYDVNSSRSTQTEASEQPMMMTAVLDDTQDNADSSVNGPVIKSAPPDNVSYDYMAAESITELTPEERLTQAEEELTLLEAQLLELDDNTQRNEYLTKIEALKAEIETLKEQLANQEP